MRALSTIIGNQLRRQARTPRCLRVARIPTGAGVPDCSNQRDATSRPSALSRSTTLFLKEFSPTEGNRLDWSKGTSHEGKESSEISAGSCHRPPHLLVDALARKQQPTWAHYLVARCGSLAR